MIDTGKYSHLVALRDRQHAMSVRLDLNAKKAPSTWLRRDTNRSPIGRAQWCSISSGNQAYTLKNSMVV